MFSQWHLPARFHTVTCGGQRGAGLVTVFPRPWEAGFGQGALEPLPWCWESQQGGAGAGRCCPLCSSRGRQRWRDVHHVHARSSPSLPVPVSSCARVPAGRRWAYPRGPVRVQRRDPTCPSERRHVGPNSGHRLSSLPPPPLLLGMWAGPGGTAQSDAGGWCWMEAAAGRWAWPIAPGGAVHLGDRVWPRELTPPPPHPAWTPRTLEGGRCG